MEYLPSYKDELYHHGILGQKWGVRRERNKEGILDGAGRQYARMKSDIQTVTKSDDFKRKLKKGAKIAAGIAITGIAIYGATQTKPGRQMIDRGIQLFNPKKNASRAVDKIVKANKKAQKSRQWQHKTPSEETLQVYNALRSKQPVKRTPKQVVANAIKSVGKKKVNSLPNKPNSIVDSIIRRHGTKKANRQMRKTLRRAYRANSKNRQTAHKIETMAGKFIKDTGKRLRK